MSEPPKDEDYSQLALEDRLVHKAWKARVDGYKTLIQEFEESRNVNDACFDLISNNPDLLKAFVTDSNVISQESGILALAKYLQYGGTTERVEKLKQHPVIRSLCEKGLASSRSGTKANTIEVFLQLVEISGSGDWVFEVISTFFDNRLPKLVAGCVNCTSQIVEQFGCSIISPKPIIPFLAKLFAHADRNVRAETTKLTVELYKWLGEGLIPLLFDSLKPVQQRDLTSEFEKVKDVKAVQIRKTRAQQAAAESQIHNGANGISEMDVDHSEDPRESFDPYEMLDPVDILSKIPPQFNQKLGSSKWQDRKEAMEELNDVLKKAPKLMHSDYSDLVRSFAKALKDANIQVVQLTANAIEFLLKGLHEEFRKYQNLVFSLMIERTKEKKPLVSQAILNAMFSIFEYSSLQDILEDTIAGMKHKTPQIKISSMNFLLKCLAVSKTKPKTQQVDVIMDVAVKLLSDPQEPVRQASTELTGTLMKIVGERELRKALANIDENRLAKVKVVYETVQVAILGQNSERTTTTSSLASKPPSVPKTKPVVQSTIKNQVPMVKAIPTKRIATSPARRDDSSSKAPAKSFTGRTLLQSKPTLEAPKLVPQASSSPEHQQELDLLRKDNALLLSRCEQLTIAASTREDEIVSLKTENGLLRAKLEQLEMELNEGNTAARQKYLKVARLVSDLDNAQSKIKSLEQKVEMAKLQQSTSLTPSLLPPMVSESSRFSPFRSPDRLSKLRLSLQELSSRVDRLSIDGGIPDAKVSEDDNDTAKKLYDFSGEEDSWRRAAEVTAELKARIEKMKQRNKMSIRP
ncbi:hypothetical protein PUMCH_000085 [Australozyma saopauloensis]|uniref:TOG domain-containing protein n=1 Tax=Australozyma saopauloensis TaxID=291208 RepID=A0AAX4H2R3_9ASCO|nr:hypothetical protein PUMCH_000085 [[Candida] saopauloensis]